MVSAFIISFFSVAPRINACVTKLLINRGIPREFVVIASIASSLRILYGAFTNSK